jgi:hypothetical protein
VTLGDARSDALTFEGQTRVAVNRNGPKSDKQDAENKDGDTEDAPRVLTTCDRPPAAFRVGNAVGEWKASDDLGVVGLFHSGALYVERSTDSG